MLRKQPERPSLRRYDPLAVLAYIATYRHQNPNRSPSERQIQKALDISAPSVVHMLLLRLEQRGLLNIIRYGRGHTSDLILTDAGRTAVQQWQQAHAAGNSTWTEGG